MCSGRTTNPTARSCSTSVATACPKRANPSTPRSPSSVRPGWRSPGSAGRWACWSAGASRAERVERVQLDERYVEYPRMDAVCEGAAFRYGYALETAWAAIPSTVRRPGGRCGPAAMAGPRRHRPSASCSSTWPETRSPPGARARAGSPVSRSSSAPVDGHSDDEGWLLTLVDDANRGASDLYVLDASSWGGAVPRRSSTCRHASPCAVTGSGFPPTATAERGRPAAPLRRSRESA